MATVLHTASRYGEKHLIEFYKRDTGINGEINLQDAMSHYNIQSTDDEGIIQQQLHSLFVTKYPDYSPQDIIAYLETSQDIDIDNDDGDIDIDDNERRELNIPVLGQVILKQPMAGRTDSDIIQLLELQFGVAATGSSAISSELYSVMCKHYECEVLLEDAIPDYAAQLESYKLEQQDNLIDQKIETSKEQAIGNQVHEIERRKRNIMHRISSARADVARSSIAKHTELTDQMLSLITDTFKTS